MSPYASAAAAVILRTCMQLKKHEKLLIITDEKKVKIAEAIFDEAKCIVKEPVLVQINARSLNGEEPPAAVAMLMLQHDVIVMATSKSFSHTDARIAATKKGARIASMPGITEDMMNRAMHADYYAIRRKTRKLAAILEKTGIVRLVTKKGTDISMDIRGCSIHGQKGGIFNSAGSWGNLPEGEACLAPKNSNGVFVADASFAGIGKIKTPITLTVRNNRVVHIKGGEEAGKLKSMLDAAGRKAYAVAELGIGTNDCAMITGHVLEDEKAEGTAHIALGNNTSFGGTNNVKLHVDGVFLGPDIYCDKRMIMNRGVFLV